MSQIFHGTHLYKKKKKTQFSYRYLQATVTKATQTVLRAKEEFMFLNVKLELFYEKNRRKGNNKYSGF